MRERERSRGSRGGKEREIEMAVKDYLKREAHEKILGKTKQARKSQVPMCTR